MPRCPPMARRGRGRGSGTRVGISHREFRSLLSGPEASTLLLPPSFLSFFLHLLFLEPVNPERAAPPGNPVDSAPGGRAGCLPDSVLIAWKGDYCHTDWARSCFADRFNSRNQTAAAARGRPGCVSRLRGAGGGVGMGGRGGSAGLGRSQAGCAFARLLPRGLPCCVWMVPWLCRSF